MSIPIVRRAVWFLAVIAFCYMVFAFYEWSPMEILIAGGVFVLCVPTDLLLHLEQNNQRSHERHSPFGPIRSGLVVPPQRATDGRRRELTPRPRVRFWWRIFRLIGTWWIWTTAAGAVIGVALYGSAATAHADPVTDAAYLSVLDDHGVKYSTERAVIDTGHAVCQAFDHGASFRGVLRVAVAAGMDAIDASTLIGAAIGSYCDEHANLLQAGTGTVTA